MAIARSHLFSQIVGSVGGVTYFYGPYASIIIRNRVTPVDPDTPAQQTVRTRFSGSMAAWQALTEAQRQAWEDFATGTPWVNSLGDDCRLTGSSMYMSIRLAALQIKPNITDSMFYLPPCIPGLLLQPNWFFTHCTKLGGFYGFRLSITNTHPTDSIKVGVQMSTPQSQSINFWKGPYDPTKYTIIGPIAPGFTTLTSWDALIQDKRYFMRLRSLSTTNQNIVSSPWHHQEIALLCHA